MNTTAKSIIIGGITAAAIMAIAGLFRTDATAQPPTTVRTIAAQPQGEWVALTIGHNDAQANITYGQDTVRMLDFETGQPTRSYVRYYYAVLFHTGTGKSRIIKWNEHGGISNYKTIDVP